LERLHPSLIVIETPLARASALELCRGIRWVNALSSTPMIFLAPNATEEARVLALEAGADDYLADSSSGREVVARVRALMRRFAWRVPHSVTAHISPPFLHFLVGAAGPTIRTGDIEIDPTAMKITVRGREIVTTSLEFRFLYYLVQHQDRVFTREQLLDAVWGSQFVERRSVDACVRRVRRKIEPNPLNPTYLRTIRGAGYSLLGASALAKIA
jgi:two-component system phosphate regulon response regulator PhoB